VKGLVAKLARGAARLAFWRKPVEAGPEPATTAADAPSVEMDPVETAPAKIAQLEVAPIEAEPASIAPTESSQTKIQPIAPSSVEATPADNSESQNSKFVSRVLGTLSKKRVWIPSVSVAMLAMMATLSFMLVQSKQATHELQAELASARKQLKQAPLNPEVAPPVLVAYQDVALHGINHAKTSPEAIAHEKAPPQVISPAAAVNSPPKPLPNIDMDCVVADKESVIKNLKNCIEGFNNAMAR